MVRKIEQQPRHNVIRKDRCEKKGRKQSFARGWQRGGNKAIKLPNLSNRTLGTQEHGWRKKEFRHLVL